MKKLISILAVLTVTSVMAQAPNLMSYQAVVWDGSNNLVVSSAVGMQISILQGSVTGTAVYEETHTATTNANGLVSVEIGAGTVVSGDISTIDWSAGPYFLKTETDPTGGTTYTITGTTQLMSVPYALHAESATNISNDQVDDADADPANEIQDISLSGTDLSISSGSTVDLTAVQDGVDDADADPANELNSGATLTTTTLNITDAGGTVSVDLASLQDGTTDADADPSNEIQTISQAGNTINLSNGGGSVTIAPSADDDPLNEIQTISISNDTIYLTDGGIAVQADPVVENTGGRSSVCSGNTAPGVGWVDYGPTGIYIDVNTSGCDFTSTPRYFASVDGTSAQWELVGVTSIYSATPTGFRIYLQKNSLGGLDPSQAAANGWFINWMAVGN
jgi:hypothetical protein